MHGIEKVTFRQSKVQSHFSWSTITHDTFAKLWSKFTHDHFFKILNDQITIMICDHFADHAPLISNCTESCFPVEGAIYSESSWPRNVKNSEVKRFWNEYMDLSSGKWIQREWDQIQDPIFCRGRDQIFDWTSNFYAEIKIRS